MEIYGAEKRRLNLTDSLSGQGFQRTEEARLDFHHGGIGADGQQISD
jgi:hypothetical protein